LRQHKQLGVFAFCLLICFYLTLTALFPNTQVARKCQAPPHHSLSTAEDSLSQCLIDLRKLKTNRRDLIRRQCREEGKTEYKRTEEEDKMTNAIAN